METLTAPSIPLLKRAFQGQLIHTIPDLTIKTATSGEHGSPHESHGNILSFGVTV